MRPWIFETSTFLSPARTPRRSSRRTRAAIANGSNLPGFILKERWAAGREYSNNLHRTGESAGYRTPFFITLSMSDAWAISSSGLDFRMTRSANLPGDVVPIFGEADERKLVPPVVSKTRAALTVAH